MQNVLSVFLALVCLLIGFQKALLLVHFKLNQTQIEQTLCINQDKPELQCHGTCHLTKTLKKANNSKSSTIAQYKQIELLPSTTLDFELNQLFIALNLKSAPYVTSNYSEPHLEIRIPPPML